MSPHRTPVILIGMLLAVFMASGCNSGGSSGNGDGQRDANIVQAPVENTDSPLGTNLSSIVDYNPEWAFVNVFLASRNWISGRGYTWDDGREIDVDEHGWVRSLKVEQIARTLLLWDLAPGSFPSGTYIVLYEGQGTLQYSGAQHSVAASTPGRDVLEVASDSGGIEIDITSVNPDNYLRNIRVIVPGGRCENDPRVYCEDAFTCAAGARCISFEENYRQVPFHPLFLSSIATYKVLRFMDWMATNDADITSWTDRPKVDDARYVTDGVPVEIMVDLANLLSADPWFTLPHTADDNFVRQFAQVVDERLAPGLHAWVEHSNEVWNSMFSQSAYARSEGERLGLGDSPYQSQIRYHSRRSVEIFDIWSQEIASDRLVRVMGSQAANSWVSTTALEFENAASSTDVLAIAPYFGGALGTPGALGTMHVDDVFDYLTDIALPDAIADMNESAAVANSYGVELVAYEGGQHLVGVYGEENNAYLNSIFDAVNRDPRMATLYADYLSAWRDAGGHLFAHYLNCGKYTKWGRWGSLESLYQTRGEAPKYDALQTFIEDNPQWW